ncbi:hypothetical protein RRG08_064503 [Elysia crispata]|uniref:Uncharacterized protein n=1 Tax=Elysia crispata TaxID=231223 RepID=A0AAE1AE57_9GAST|nr:hypothetical protein RRG08_064503 [Elysia crispata]
MDHSVFIHSQHSQTDSDMTRLGLCWQQPEHMDHSVFIHSQHSQTDSYMTGLGLYWLQPEHMDHSVFIHSQHSQTDSDMTGLGLWWLQPGQMDHSVFIHSQHSQTDSDMTGLGLCWPQPEHMDHSVFIHSQHSQTDSDMTRVYFLPLHRPVVSRSLLFSPLCNAPLEWPPGTKEARMYNKHGQAGQGLLLCLICFDSMISNVRPARRFTCSLLHTDLYRLKQGGAVD